MIMIAVSPKWSKERDLQLIQLIFKGMTQEGIESESGLTPIQQGNRLKKLGLTIGGGRKAKRDGMTAENYLETSAIYRPVEAIQESLFSNGLPHNSPLNLAGHMLGRAAGNYILAKHSHII
jgi:hypothetical protein